MDLRKFVGHNALIGIGATTLVFNTNKELLLNLRSDTNTWGLPGGSMELYESIEIDTTNKTLDGVFSLMQEYINEYLN